MTLRSIVCFAAALCAFGAAAKSPADYVNPMIGTDGMGHTFPGACAPFGIVQLSPDTDTIPHNVAGKYQKEVYETCAGYRYGDPTIVGFSHTHFSGTGHSDLGDILVMPGVGKVKLNPGTAADPDGGYRSRFSHEGELSSPGYYAVTLSDSGIRAEMTASQRVGIHRYTYPAGAENKHIIIDLQHGIYNYDGKTLWAELRVIDERHLAGYRITSGWARSNYTYFAVELSQPISEYGFTDHQKVNYRGGWSKFDQYHNFPEMAGRKLVAWFKFDDAAAPVLEMKVALSAVGIEGAMKNLCAETEGKSFDTVREETLAAWNREMESIEVEGSEDEKAMFYTSWYHTMINPSVYMDVDGRYRGLDREIHVADGFTNYTVFSLWDTYRAEHPLMALMKPAEARDMAVSMIRHQQQSAHHMLPIWSHMGNENWCMSGYHAVSVLSDAITKGLYINAKEALDAMVATSNVRYYGGLGDYIDKGYVPNELTATSASNTLEYCYDDWTIYHAALLAGREDIAEKYRARALNYRNIFDPALGFARPRNSDGSWREPFDVLQTWGEGFIEGNSWNFSFHVPHDVYGDIAAMGGEKEFLRKLDVLFGEELDEKYYADNEDVTAECLIGGYVHGNEPSHHIPYLFAWTSQPWKTQYWLREVMNSKYRNDIRGLGGNDDCGQMSAWYIFTALGFYPVCPGTDQYVLGAPYLPYLKLSLPNGRTFEVKAPKVSDAKRYVKAVKLNGAPLSRLYITHEEILNGGVLEFEMASKPNKRRGLSPSDKPYSLTNGK